MNDKQDRFARLFDADVPDGDDNDDGPPDGAGRFFMHIVNCTFVVLLLSAFFAALSLLVMAVRFFLHQF